MRFALLVVAGAACSANDDVPAPTLAGVLPDRGVPGVIVTVTGAALCQTPHEDDPDGTPVLCPDSGGAVYFDGHLGAVLAWEDTEIMVEVPPAMRGTVDLRAQVNGRSSNAIDFIVE